MSIINTGTSPKRLVPGVHHFYGLDYKQKDKIYGKLFKVETSRAKFEEIVSLAGTGIAVVKNEGDQLSADDMTQGYTTRLVHAAYGKVMFMTKEAVDDDQYAPKLSEKIGSCFAKSMLHTEEVIAHNVINNGFSATTSNMYNNPDGKALFATDHPLVKGGTFSNKLTTAADLSEAAIETLSIQIMNYTDDAGIRLGIMPKKLLVSTNDAFNAQRLVLSPLQTGTAHNDINTINRMGLDLIVSPYLTDTDAWFLVTSENDSGNGLLMFKRNDVDMDADTDFMTKNGRFSIYSRFSVGYSDPRAIAGSEGA